MDEDLKTIFDHYPAQLQDSQLVSYLKAFVEKHRIDYPINDHVATLEGMRAFLNAIGYQLIPEPLEQR